MQRSKGFNEVGDGGGTYTEDVDFLIQHYEGTNNEVYGVIEGDLVILSGSTIAQEDAAAFTTGVECHGVVHDSTLWITNGTDGLRYKTIGAGIATPTQEPAATGNTVDKDRIYYHKLREQTDYRLGHIFNRKIVQNPKSNSMNVWWLWEIARLLIEPDVLMLSIHKKRTRESFVALVDRMGINGLKEKDLVLHWLILVKWKIMFFMGTVAAVLVAAVPFKYFFKACLLIAAVIFVFHLISLIVARKFQRVFFIE